MSKVILTRSDLFSQTQAGAILGVDRRTVRDLVVTLKLEYKLDPTRSGKFLDRADIERIATPIGVTLDWTALGLAD